MKFSAPLALSVLIGAATPALANDFALELTELADREIRGWVSDPVVIDAVAAQNAETAAYTQDQIDTLDTEWRAQTATGGTLIDRVLSAPLSAHLVGLQEQADGLYSEIFVTDARGLNVGQSAVTSDYWQGDEAKWQHPFQTGEMHLGEVEFDESSQTYASQVSLPITDGGAIIGAITVGVNLDMLAP